MQAPGFWDDQETAAKTSAEHARAQKRLTGFRSLEDRRRRSRRPARDGGRGFRDRLRARLAARLGRAASRGARGGAPLQRRVRLGRRRGDGALGRRRHRLAGLGRDAPSHVPALGGAPRLRGRDGRGVRGRGGGTQDRHLHRQGRERLRPLRRRARSPPPRPHLALRLAVAPPHRLRPGRRGADGLRRGRRSRSTRTTFASTPTALPARAVST